MLRVGLFIAVMAGAVFAASYTVAPIPLPTGFTVVGVQTINNFGQVAITGYNSSAAAVQGFIGSSAGFTAIPMPSGNWTSSAAVAVNNAGQVALSLTNATTSQAAIGSVSGSSLIPFPAGWFTATAAAINDSGAVAGSGEGNGVQAFIGTTAASIAVPTPSGWNFTSPNALNNSGQIAGLGFYATGGAFRAFIGSSSGSTAIPLPSGWTEADAWAINDSGQVVGYGDTNFSFIGTAAGSTAIPPPTGATFSQVTLGSINNNGMVVGYSSLGGWIWDAVNGTVLLDSLVPPGWFVGNAEAISNNGHILASASFNGGVYQYVILSPIPPPSAPTLDYPTNSLMGTSLTPTLRWEIAQGATSYDVYLGTSPSSLSLLANVTTGTYTPSPLASSTAYYWQVVAKNGAGNTPSGLFTFTTFNSACSFSASPSPVLISYLGGGQQINVTTGSGCAWTPITTDPWLLVNTLGPGIGNGSFLVRANQNAGTAQLAHVSFANQTVGVMQSGSPSAPIFDDVPPSYPYFDYVSLLSNYGITAGCQSSPPLYCPDTPVTRAQMAVFVVAGLDLAMGTPLTYPSTAYFQDITASGPDSAYFPYVQRIAQLGITAGCQTSPALFCPDSQITQAQMAVFMIRAWMLANNLTTFSYPQTPYFTDVPASNQYFPFVQKMVQLGFWQGCTATVYCQGSPVTRGQTAPMIMRSMLGAP